MELLIRVHDKLDVAHPKADRVCGRGDVVVACRDGHPWTENERTAPFWRIIKVPDLAEIEAQMLTQPRLVITQDGAMITGRRAKTLDLASLPKTFIEDDSRSQPWISVNAETIRSCTQAKLDRSRIA